MFRFTRDNNNNNARRSFGLFFRGNVGREQIKIALVNSYRVDSPFYKSNIEKTNDLLALRPEENRTTAVGELFLRNVSKIL